MIPLSYAFDDYHTTSTLNLDTRISGSVDNARGVNALRINLSFFPRTTEFVSVIDSDYPSQSTEYYDYIFTEYKNIDEELLNYNFYYKLNSNFNIKEVKSKIQFPIQDIPSEYLPYIEATDLINSNDQLIKNKAYEIIKGEDDLYEAVYKIGKWNNENINYSLDSLTEELTQDSRWVLQNREGVCDELTVLFIAMLRSQGVPAKFISGQSYTNLIPGFGNHAWAEVYFPGKGWIPFDVTYGQYGYVDATHIKMKESANAKEPSIRYSWSPGSIDIQPTTIDIKTDVTFVGSEISKAVNLNIDLLKNHIGTGSSLPIEITLENLKDYYVATTLYITKSASETKDNTMGVLLKPKETNKFYWIIPLPDLDSGYVYTSDIEITDFFGSSDYEKIEYSDKYEFYSFPEAEEKVYKLSLENRNPESSLDLFCKPNKVTYYDYETAKLVCQITNSENKIYNDLNLCFINKCENFNLENGKKELTFDINLDFTGTKENHAELSNSEMIKNSYFDVTVLNSPNLKILNLEYPEEIKYGEMSKIIFDLPTETTVKDLEIKLNGKTLFFFQTYQGRDDFEVPFSSNYFYNHKNSKLILEYTDFNGKKYSYEKEFQIKVTNVPFYVVIGYWWFIILAAAIVFMIYRRYFFRLDEAPKPMKNKKRRR
jgi:transglutaminase-like putative cysteine protease